MGANDFPILVGLRGLDEKCRLVETRRKFNPVHAEGWVGAFGNLAAI